MAVRRTVSAAPVRKLRKNHGPKRHLWHGYDKVGRIDFGRIGILSKYWDKESFALAANARGIKADINELWAEYSVLKTCALKDQYLRSIKDHAQEIAQRKAKKSLTKIKK